MKKLIIQKELICPFNKCRFPYAEDKDGNLIFKGMGINCTSCRYVWNRKTESLNDIEILDEDSKEYKEYKYMFTPVEVKRGDNNET